MIFSGRREKEKIKEAKGLLQIDPTIDKIFQYCNKAIQAERKQKYEKMWKYIAKAEEVPVKTEFQRWTLDYMKAVNVLRYGSETDMGEATRKLLQLRKEAKESPHLPYQLVHENYVRLLVSVLHRNYMQMGNVPEYGELAQELVELVEREHRHTLDDTDLYALAYIMLGQYYGNIGHAILKEECLEKVWDAAQCAPVISNYCFCALVTYIDNLQFQGKYLQAVDICLFLDERMHGGKVKGVNQGDLNQFVVSTCNLFMNFGDSGSALRLIEEALEKGIARPWRENGEDSAIRENMLGVYSCYLSGLSLQQRKCPWERMEEITAYLERYYRDLRFPGLSPWERSNFYLTCYRRDRLAKSQRSRALWHLGQCSEVLLEEDFPERDRIPFLINMIEVIQEYGVLRRQEKAADCVDRLMHKMLEYYAMAEYYQENKEMENYFGICRLGFEIAYQAVGNIACPEKRMEYSINGKNLLSTAIRFRNQLDAGQVIKREKHPDAFPYYSFSQLEERMPEDTAVIEFLYMEPDVYKNRKISIETEGRIRVLEIFVVAKGTKGIRFLSKKTKDEGEIGRWVEKLGERMEAQGSGSRILSQKIFGKILEPFADILKDIRHLWICPDLELYNAPFEVILDAAAKDWTVQDIVYWQSLRDIFQDWNPEGGNGKICAIGDPDYSLKEREEKKRLGKEAAISEEERNARWIRDQIVPLPFSGYEARKAAGMFQSQSYTHSSATKDKVRAGYCYLHIATHGYSKQDGGDAWYESSLAFSGIADYLGTGVEDPDCGNGILTAEEVSRMRLNGTELAVLSACSSGNSLLTSLRQQTGLHVAFGVAGVKYVVAALWSADDLAAAVFMSYFYQGLLDGMAVPKAVSFSRARLRTVSVKEVLGMLDADEQLLPPEAAGIRLRLEAMPQDYQLYNNPAYWGNFICYENMV